MPVLDEDGFLQGAVANWIYENRTRFQGFVNDAEALNRICHEFMIGRSIALDNPRQLVVSVLFVRMIELYQSVLLLTFRGMRSASAVCFRALIEAYFHFEAIRNDESYLNEFLDQFHVDRVRVASGIARSESEGLAELRDHFTTERLQAAKRDKEAAGAKKLTTEAAAKRGGTEGIYRTAYALLSAEVHTSARSLESHLVWDDESESISGLRYGPDEGNYAKQVGLSIVLLSGAFEEVCRVFEEPCSSIVHEIKDRQHARLGSA
jgi:hypothetical protein